MKRKFYLLLIWLLVAAGINAQVTIGSNVEPAKGAILDLKSQAADPNNVTSTTGGLVLPRAQLENKNSIALFFGGIEPSADALKLLTGLIVYNLTNTGDFSVGPYNWDGTQWVPFAGAGGIEYEGTDPIKVTGTTIKLIDGSANGQVLKWNQATTKWEPAADDNTTYTARNGIKINNNQIELGANPLQWNTHIINDGHDLHIEGTGRTLLQSPTVISETLTIPRNNPQWGSFLMAHDNQGDAAWNTMDDVRNWLARATNGLSKTADGAIKLGGTLTEDTRIYNKDKVLVLGEDRTGYTIVANQLQYNQPETTKAPGMVMTAKDAYGNVGWTAITARNGIKITPDNKIELGANPLQWNTNIPYDNKTLTLGSDGTGRTSINNPLYIPTNSPKWGSFLMANNDQGYATWVTMDQARNWLARATNGLSKTAEGDDYSGAIKLGGTLTQTTYINDDGFDLILGSGRKGNTWVANPLRYDPAAGAIAPGMVMTAKDAAGNVGWAAPAAAGLTSARNGLKVDASGKTAELGGTLGWTTTIDNAGNDLWVNGTGRTYVTTPTTVNGTLQYNATSATHGNGRVLMCMDNAGTAKWVDLHASNANATVTAGQVDIFRSYFRSTYYEGATRVSLPYTAPRDMVVSIEPSAPTPFPFYGEYGSFSYAGCGIGIIRNGVYGMTQIWYTRRTNYSEVTWKPAWCYGPLETENQMRLCSDNSPLDEWGYLTTKFNVKAGDQIVFCTEWLLYGGGLSEEYPGTEVYIH